MNIFSRLQDNDLLKYLNDQEFAIVSGFGKEFNYPKNTIFQVDTCLNLYVIKNGKISHFTADKESLPLFFEECSDLEILWEPPFFLQKPDKIQFLCIEETTVIQYSKDDLERVFATHPLIELKIQAALNDSLCEKNIRLTQRVLRDTNE
ncbi:MAG TPA: hypothetical protein PL063_05495 [Candidatus Cloacimonadota bacterium]|nr:hypothetical protein [Candidatus Cloacimonadota bacterium]HQB41566.1 hypothetical protein [Candidatus Cloacimonadota bacterium]